MTSTQLAWKIRRHAVEMTHISGGSHIGAVLSAADLIAVLYSDILHYRPQEPRWPQRDRFILSKGHAAIALYAALAETGFFPLDALLTYCQNGSILSGHVSHDVPGVEFSTGSLGHGLGISAGMAIAAKKDKKDHRVFAVLGDGECNEGSVWESAQAAATFGLHNLTVIVDHNHMQSLDFCDRTQCGGSLADKWRAFGFHTMEVNGHDHDALRAALKTVDPSRPTAIIAHTVKGYPIPFMENNILWHYRYPHEGWEYDYAVTALHKIKPQDVTDPYTPNGITNPHKADDNADIYADHTMGATYHPTWFSLQEVNR